MRRKYLAVLLAASVLFAPASASAAGGFTISPANQEVILAEGAEETSFELSLTNRDNAEVMLRLKVVDFKALDESGGIAFLGLKANQTETRYGLTAWLRFSADSVSVAPGETEKVVVTIDNRDSLSPGGHYGAVVAVPVDPANPAAMPEVDILPATAALVLLKKQGGEQYGLNLDSAALARSGWGMPSSISLRFQNTGNIHVVPRGTVAVRGPGGQEVSKAIINETSGVVLPETFRKLTTGFMVLRRPFWPGRYQAVINWRYDGREQSSQQIISFWYMGFGIYLFGAVSLLFVAILWITLRKSSKKHSKTTV